MRLEDRALKSALPGMLLLAITVLQPLALVPVLLTHWGDVRYGVWILLASIATSMQSLDAGFQNFAGNEFIQIHASHPSKLRPLVTSALRVSYSLGLVQLVVGAIMLFTGWFDLLLPIHLSAQEVLEARKTFAVMFIYWGFLGSVSGLLGRLYAPVGLYFRAQWWGVITRLAFLLAVVSAAAFGAGLYGAWLTGALVGLLACCMQVLDMQRVLGSWFNWWSGGDFITGLKYFWKSLVLSGAGMLDSFVMAGILVSVGNRLQGNGIALFATLRTMAGLLGQSAMLVAAPITPDLVRFVVKKEEGKLDDTLRVLHLICLGGGGLLLVLLSVAAEPLYAFWTRHTLSFDYAAFALLAWAALVRLAGLPSGIILRSLNQNQLLIVIAAVQAAYVFSVFALLPAVLSTWMTAAVVASGDVLSSWLLPRWLLKQELKRRDMSLGASGKVDALLIFWLALSLGCMFLPKPWNWLVTPAMGVTGVAAYFWHSRQRLSSEAKHRLLGLWSKLLGRFTGRQTG